MDEPQLTNTEDTTNDNDLALLAKSKEPVENDLTVTSRVYSFVQISNPDLAYLTTTTKIDFSDKHRVSSLTDGFQTISLYTSKVILHSSQLDNWGVPPFTEDPKPTTIYSSIPSSMEWTLSQPSKIFGFELMPRTSGTFPCKVDFYTRNTLIGSITRTITVPGPPLGPKTDGARLFAAITDGPGFDTIKITCLSSVFHALLVGQIRYQGCVTLCNPIIKETTTKQTEIPVSCHINVPGYEVINVSNDIKARIIDTSFEIKEDFVCPQYGQIPGVKTATAKIFVELQIPVTIHANGCPPVTLEHTCYESVVFAINNVFVSGEISNCEGITVNEVKGFDFKISSTTPDSPHCSIEGFASISATVSACVMASSINVIKCP